MSDQLFCPVRILLPFSYILNPRATTYIDDEDGMAATGTLGRVDEFDGTKDDWLQYIERLEHFFAANGIDDAAKKRAVLLSVVGAATYKILRSIVSPSKPGEKSYAELVEALSKYFKPTPVRDRRTFQVSFSCAKSWRVDR